MLKVMLMEKLREQKGALMVAMALLLPVIIGCTGIAVDFGHLYMEKGRLQNYADAAALAGLTEFKKHEHYVQGTGSLVDRMPLAAVRDDKLSEEFTARINEAANEYLMRNSGNEFHLDMDGVEANVYRLVTEEDTAGTATRYTYYYEIIVGKYYPVYFSRIVYPHDIEVRAGAICKVEVEDVRIKLTYDRAREIYGNIPNVPLANLLHSDSAERLDADIEGLTNIASAFLHLTKDEVKLLLNGKSDASNMLLGHYEETTGVSTYNKANMDQDTFFKLLTKNENEVFDATKRYLFSDYATQHQDGVKLWLTYKNGEVSQVRVAINPADAANGSQPLSVTLNAD